MTAKIHRALTAAISGITGLTALLAATDPNSLQLSGTEWAYITLGLAVINIVVTAFRQAFDTNAT